MSRISGDIKHGVRTMEDGFYRAFEERYRGSRELIKSRMRVYLPFIEPLTRWYGEPRAVDLGCGRGEWLELLHDSGFIAQGVDLDDGMLAACRERELKVQTGDAVAFLKELPDASQAVVSGFHLAEHLPFAALQALVAEALRVLKPAGLLILETPNPENIVVGATDFYLDPTHLRPIPPPLLAFLTEHYGFKRAKILRLYELPELAVKERVELADVLAGASPDYSVVAQKAAAPAIIELFDAAFERHYGIEPREIANRYDETISRRLDAFDTRLTRSEAEAGENIDQRFAAFDTRLTRSEAHATEIIKQRFAALDTRLTRSEVQAGEIGEVLKVKLDELNRSFQHWQSIAAGCHQELHTMYASRSWRITAPLRWLDLQIRRLRDHGLVACVNGLVKKVVMIILRRGVRFVNMRSGLLRFCGYLAHLFGVYDRVREVAMRLTSEPDALTAPDPRQVHSDVVSEAAKPPGFAETLTIDELLSRIRAEIAVTQEQRKES